MKSGIELIKSERIRQIQKEGYSARHDDKHTNGDIADAAACYAAAAGEIAWAIVPKPRQIKKRMTEGYELCWPWENRALKISKDPIRSLVKAGALIAAEIDRLQRIKH